MITKEELFKKYSIDESHNIWEEGIDSWMSIEIYRIMHEGNLPPANDMSVDWITKFLDKCHDTKFFMELRKRKQDDFGSLYLTAKRMVYAHADKLI
jgi:hypothetical protein